MNVICKITCKYNNRFIESLYYFDIMCGYSNLEIIEKSLKQFRKRNKFSLDKFIITKIEVCIE